MQISLVSREANNQWLATFVTELNSIYRKNIKVKSSLKETQKRIEHQFQNRLDSKESRHKDALEKVTILRDNLSKFLVKQIILDYIQLLDEKGIDLRDDVNIAFDFYGSGILVWVETANDDVEFEMQLKEVEGKINSKYAEQKLKMATNYFDRSFGFSFPPQYI